MKKNILKLAFASAFAFVAGYGIYASQQEVEMSDLALANVEALAQSESDGDTYCPNPGYQCIIKYSNGTYTTYHGRWP